ncbi:iron-sulfur cluster assembly scaffold protein [Candidatus Pacearchaeota archaeon]|nr:iron-sulfur cluster assembly scaffold protein [Candidatus Pacearchaeota archaeon]
MKYSKKVMQNFMNPKNMGEMKNPDGVGRIGNPRCGDVMQVFIKVGRRSAYPKEGQDPKLRNKGAKIKEEYLKDVKFKTFGCMAAIATSSMITQLAKGKKLEDAKKITSKDVAESLKGLPPIKMHCSNLASDALKDAIKDYKTKNVRRSAYPKLQNKGAKNGK